MPGQIFLCHASEDKSQVDQYYRRLKELGFKPWLDKKDLLPGQNWRVEIPKAIKASDFVLIFLSHRSVQKRGYVQKEFKLALEVLDEIPSGRVFIIPVRLDDCQIPEEFQDLHWADLFQDNGFEAIVRSVRMELGHGVPPLTSPEPLSSRHPDIYVHKRTGLMWTRKDNGGDITWEEANQHAKNLSLGGYTDWQWSTIDELESIYDPNNVSGYYRLPETTLPIYTVRGIQLSGPRVWSSTKESSIRACIFCFESGVRGSDGIPGSAGLRALCVRGD
jgi:hypothetical protein